MLKGIVIHGDGIGKKLGFPTANLDIDKKKCKFNPGVYAAKVLLDKKEYQGALAIQEKNWKVEVHFLDYVGEDFYGSFIEVEPIQKVSEMEGFSGENSLIEKINNDVEKVREVFKVLS
ncbi:MAG: riboflavin kinase [Candidatus Magasanikiibacteriota bacterium]